MMSGVRVAVQQVLAVRDGYRVDLGIDHPATRCGLLGHLVHVALGGDTGPDVEELADPGRGQAAYRPAEKGPAGPGAGPDVRLDGDHRPGQILVDQELVRAAEQIVVDAGDVRPLGVHTRWDPIRLARHGLSFSSWTRKPPGSDSSAMIMADRAYLPLILRYISACTIAHGRAMGAQGHHGAGPE